jgi:hypothetical protein
MAAARLPLAYRDNCAHLLVPLNKCRYDTFYLPWKCEVTPNMIPKEGRRAARSGELKLLSGCA